MNHLVLLGDSIFDNAVYVAPEPEGRPVIDWLAEEVPAGWKASLLAIDGSITHHVPDQLGRVPADATHLVVSVGGNDALQRRSFLNETARSTAGVMMRLTEIRQEFRDSYARMLEAVLDIGKPTVLCTVYEPRFPDPAEQQLAVTALTVFNDAIISLAVHHGLPLLDLRKTCREDSDFANPIEPSSSGGRRIAKAIVRLLKDHTFPSSRTTIYS